jgi:signal transduction histidine kinase
MVDHLQSSLQAQRQLLDDVGHELRTPITIVQGHLELQDNEDPEDVRHTQELSLDELSRMNLLVDDIVTIAQANRRGFVHLENVDISGLLDDILSKALELVGCLERSKADVAKADEQECVSRRNVGRVRRTAHAQPIRQGIVS